MKKICTLLAALWGGTAYLAAQPTLTATVFPEVGDLVATVMADTAGVGPGPAGAGLAWNFSDLQADTATARTVRYVPAAGTSQAVYFPQANVASFEADDLPDTVFHYHRFTPAEWLYYGHAVGGVQYVYPNPVLELKAPLGYGQNFTDNFSYYSTLPDNSVNGVGAKSAAYDAYGTLQLPETQFAEAVRLKTETQLRDTTILFAGYSVNNLTVLRYDWYAPGFAGPQLTIEYRSGTSTYYLPGQPPNVQTLPPTKTVRYVSGQTVPATEPPGPVRGSWITAYGPNPATDAFTVHLNGSGKVENLRWMVSDALGRTWKMSSEKDGANAETIALSVSSLPSGTYFLTLFAGRACQTLRWEKR